MKEGRTLKQEEECCYQDLVNRIGNSNLFESIILSHHFISSDALETSMFVAEIRIPMDRNNEMVSTDDRLGRSVIVGFAEVSTTSDFCFKLGDDYPFKEFRPKINSLVVQKEFRSMGIGMQLLATCVAQARLWGHDDIMLEVRDDNVRGIKFYQRMGFTENLRKMFENYQLDTLLMNVVDVRMLEPKSETGLFMRKTGLKPKSPIISAVADTSALSSPAIELQSIL